MSRQICTYRDALRIALREILNLKPQAFLMGEDVGRYGGAYAVSKGLLDEFGEERIRDTPLSESTFVGAGIGAALGGMLPIVEIMTVNFSLLALDQIVNNASTLYHMSGGQANVPLVIRMATGAGKQLAAQHSHSLEGMYAHFPGLKVLVPSTVQDAYDMLWAAIEDPNPVLIFEHIMLYNLEGELLIRSERQHKNYSSNVFTSQVRRQGKDVTLISLGGCMPKSLDAASELEKEGIDCEVIDLRSLRPFDPSQIVSSIKKTHRAIIIDEGWKSVGFSAEVSAQIMEHSFHDLRSPVHRIATKEVPIPYSAHLELAALPQKDDIIKSVKEILSHV